MRPTLSFCHSHCKRFHRDVSQMNWSYYRKVKYLLMNSSTLYNFACLQSSNEKLKPSWKLRLLCNLVYCFIIKMRLKNTCTSIEIFIQLHPIVVTTFFQNGQTREMVKCQESISSRVISASNRTSYK